MFVQNITQHNITQKNIITRNTDNYLHNNKIRTNHKSHNYPESVETPRGIAPICV